MKQVTAWQLIVWAYRDQAAHKDRLTGAQYVPAAVGGSALGGAVSRMEELGVAALDGGGGTGRPVQNDADLVDNILMDAAKSEGPMVFELIRLASQGVEPSWEPDAAHLPADERRDFHYRRTNASDGMFKMAEAQEAFEQAMIAAGLEYYTQLRNLVRLVQVKLSQSSKLEQHIIKGCGLKRTPTQFPQ